ncbi:MAG: family 16 glycoside hydrolase, partial [Bacteroidota bacterium]
MPIHRILAVFALCLIAYGAATQSWDTIPLVDLSAFDQNPANWSIVGTASGSIASTELDTDRGTGILYSRSRNSESIDLETQFTHGDLDMELEFMLPKDGESGLFLQGRYEIQLSDSWQKHRPTYLDAGAVSPIRKMESQQLTGGKPPRVNAAKAPGLWQHLSVSFRAARFDRYGQKLEDARLLFVKLNGIIVHENVVLTGPTDQSHSNEVARGPLRLQAENGEVAFRNICVQAYDLPPLQWKSLQYQSGIMQGPGAYEMSPQIEERGTADLIDSRLVSRNEKLVLRFDGEIEFPVSGLYKFDVEVWWNARLTIDGQPTATTPSSSNGSTEIELSAGTHRIVLEYYKWDSWYQGKLALYLTGPGIARQALHEESSLPVSALPTPHFVDFGRETQILRAFTHYTTDEESSTKLTHTVHVGLREGIAFTYDPLQAIPVQVWRGRFLDATPMWADRGDGSVSARGAVTHLDTLPIWMSAED